MKIHAPSFGIAGGIVSGTAYTALGLILKFWPAATLQFIGTSHMLPKLTLIKSFIKVTPQAIAMGIAAHTIIGFSIFFLIATIYNLLQGLFKK
jgi:hypothetical protein